MTAAARPPATPRPPAKAGPAAPGRTAATATTTATTGTTAATTGATGAGATATAAAASCCHVAARDLPADRRRGAEIRVVLGPKTVGSSSGFMGVATLAPGEKIAEHYHPYSEEFLYVARGAIVVDCDGRGRPVGTDEGLYIPVNARHRLRNTGTEPATVVFHLGPLAPRPELGHVDTEDADGNPMPVRSVPTTPGKPSPPPKPAPPAAPAVPAPAARRSTAST